jgi:hypothetical protein
VSSGIWSTVIHIDEMAALGQKRKVARSLDATGPWCAHAVERFLLYLARHFSLSIKVTEYRFFPRQGDLRPFNVSQNESLGDNRAKNY